MKTYKFRTNVKCQGCKAAISPYLDKEKTIASWRVDIYDPERILIVEGDEILPDRIIELLKNAGYSAELM